MEVEVQSVPEPHDEKKLLCQEKPVIDDPVLDKHKGKAKTTSMMMSNNSDLDFIKINQNREAIETNPLETAGTSTAPGFGG